jgi:hypothetical protein
VPARWKPPQITVLLIVAVLFIAIGSSCSLR